MNSLNLLSARVIGTAAAQSPRQRSRSSQGEDLRRSLSEELLRGRSHSSQDVPTTVIKNEPTDSDNDSIVKSEFAPEIPVTEDVELDEKQPLLASNSVHDTRTKSHWHYLVKRIADAITTLLATIGMPIIYVARCFKDDDDDDGHYSVLLPFKKRRRKGARDASHDQSASEKLAVPASGHPKLQHKYSSDSLNSLTSESDSDARRHHERKLKKEKLQEDDALTHRRRSSRIRLLHNEDVTKRKQKRSALAESTPLTVDNIKSPTSASTARKLRYPHAPQPPRPLIPRRQPSYSNITPLSPVASVPRRLSLVPHHQQKTLVIDLDETLIHSIAKGGRMSSGHMVEVKLNAPVFNPVAQVGGGHPSPPPILGPQHPILYYVHKRPHCDEFLRKISKWYKCVIFTASVQEYADPVIDWLEQERKFFQGRYYRQHCTLRNGSYIKDLSSIEPDLSKVIILDNSPVSYVFHEDNAVPIEGWINDPTDNDLLHLIPLFEALQYVTDVRALLALRRGEAEASAASA